MGQFTQKEYKEILDKVEKLVQEHCEVLDTTHDWDHVNRVRNLAVRLYKSTYKDQINIEDLQNLELIALLHDVGDAKFGYDQKELISSLVGPLFDDQSNKVDLILEEVSSVSWRKSLKRGSQQENDENQNEQKKQLKLSNFVSDADRLDAMGCIGIARCFAYGGSRHSKLYDLSVKPNLNHTKESYGAQTDILHDGKIIPAKSQNNCLNHFYEKLLKLKDSLATEEGKKLSVKRHQRLLDFVEEFLSELQSDS